MPEFSLRRAKPIKRENASEYFYKDMIVEPRQNVVMKTFSSPFNLDDIPKGELHGAVMLEDNFPSGSISQRTIVPTMPQDSVFLNYVEEQEKTRKNYFEDQIMGQLKNEIKNAPQVIASDRSSPRTTPTQSERTKWFRPIA